MIKIIGCIVIVLSCSGLGYVMGMKFKSRVRELRCFNVALQMLETEIVYSNTPLPDAFDIIYKKTGSPADGLFKLVGINLNKKNHSTVGETFACSLNEIKSKLSINKEDIDILKSFGNSLGCSDIEGQEKNFKTVTKQLENQEKKAEESRAKNERMYKNIGILAGIAIAIVLM